MWEDGEQRVSTIERIVHRIEEHIEEWREQDKALKREAEAGGRGEQGRAVGRGG